MSIDYCTECEVGGVKSIYGQHHYWYDLMPQNCSWCGGDVFKPHRNKAGELFCSINHRTASNRALKRLLNKPVKQIGGVTAFTGERREIIR